MRRYLRRPFPLLVLQRLFCLCLFCLPAFSQEPAVVRIGVALPNVGSKDVSASELRNRLVKALSHKDKKLKLLLQAVALDAVPGNKAIAEAREKNCQFVLYSQVRPVETSSKFQPANGTPGEISAVAVATVEYQLRRAPDGASYSIGTAKGDGSISEREAIFDAVERIGGKVAADFKNGGNSNVPPVEPAEAATEQTSPGPGEVVTSADFCSWLPADIPHAGALRGVCEYAIALPHDMPNFICQQETSRYESHNRVPSDLITATVRYEDGNESYSDLKVNGRPVPDAMVKTAGLWSSGQFQGNLRAIFHQGNHAGFEFSGEKRLGEHAAWVFTYQIARQNEPLWELSGEDQVTAPPYAGELWVDQKTGAVLRFRSAAKDLPASFPMRSAEILIDYDNVAFGDGTAFVLPAASSIATRFQGMEPSRNVVQFRGCHKFRAKARMVFNTPAETSGKESAEANSAESLARDAEQNETIYAILREQAIREDSERLEIEQRQDMNLVAVAAFSNFAALEQQRQKNAVSAMASANHAPPDSAKAAVTTFKVSVKLVPVSVVVRNTKGNAVGDLDKKNFQLFDERQPQAIRSFSMEKSRGGPASWEPPKTALRAESEANDRRPGPAEENDVAYVFDDLQTTFEDLGNVIAAAQKHLSALHPEDRAAVFTTSGEVALDFTFDRQKLQAALRALKPHSRVTSDCPPVSYYMADLIVNQGDAGASALAVDETMRCANVVAVIAKSMAKQKALEVAELGRVESERTLQVLHDIIARTAAMPGRRNIVLVSAGFLTVAPDAQDKEMSLINQAVQAGIIVNTLDVQGVPDPGISASNSEDLGRGLFDRQEALARSEVLADLAYGTGGMFFRNNNDLQRGFRETANIPEYIYVLGFSPQKLDGKFHRLKVKVTDAEKVTVQARPGYYALKPASSK
jgi:VWFA-related protein